MSNGDHYKHRSRNVARKLVVYRDSATGQFVQRSLSARRETITVRAEHYSLGKKKGGKKR
jgi:hypothetical protein